MFGWLKKRHDSASGEVTNVPVFLNPLAMLLAAREEQKGSPLTEQEVIAIRDDALCVMMTPTQAAKFYESLDAQFPYPRIDPERCWEQWQALREQSAD